MAQAVGGLMHITGAAAGPPQKVGVAITDVMTGVLSAGAVCVHPPTLPVSHICYPSCRKCKAGVLLCSTGAAAGARLAGSTLNLRCLKRKCSLSPT
jgi:hypothetical protein